MRWNARLRELPGSNAASRIQYTDWSHIIYCDIHFDFGSIQMGNAPRALLRRSVTQGTKRATSCHLVPGRSIQLAALTLSDFNRLKQAYIIETGDEVVWSLTRGYDLWKTSSLRRYKCSRKQHKGMPQVVGMLFERILGEISLRTLSRDEALQSGCLVPARPTFEGRQDHDFVFSGVRSFKVLQVIIHRAESAQGPTLLETTGFYSSLLDGLGSSPSKRPAPGCWC